MDVVPPVDVDPVWWAEKTKLTAIEYCPRCRFDVDPRDSHFVPRPCDTHQWDSGSADGRASEKREAVLVYVPDWEFL